MIKLATPRYLLKFIHTILPISFLCMIISGITGFYYAFFGSPIDYQQGEYVRFMYIHVPSAWGGIGSYIIVGVFSFLGLVSRLPVAFFIAYHSAVIGGLFTFIALITGALWGKPIWGTWWVWDARLTSMFILFCFYIGYILLVKSYDKKYDRFQGLKYGGFLAMIGLVNIPIIKWSVNWWHTLHQPASILKIGGPSIHASMLTPLMIMMIAWASYFITFLCINLKTELLKLRFYTKQNLR